MILTLTKKVIIAVVVIAVIAIGVTLGVIFIGGDDGNDTTTVQTTIETTEEFTSTTESLTDSSTDSSTTTPTEPPDNTPRIIKIPENFKIGTTTAAYQIEGGWNADGKGPSIWDTFTHEHPAGILDQTTGNIADNSYEKYQDDVDALASIGMQFYRFSIAWSRVLPTGDIPSRNDAGIQYYHKLIDALLDKGIEPMVTMYHWDLPQYLQDMGGFMNPIFVDYFEAYANLLFDEYGGKVKKWITFNEPSEYCSNGYGIGRWPPALRLLGVGEYYCAHHTILAHARAYHLYKDKYFVNQQGQVGIALNSEYAFPEDEDNPDQVQAAIRSMQWEIGLYAHPIFTEVGDYPEIVRETVDRISVELGFASSRLPYFTAAEVEYIKGTSDFLGLNYYTSKVVIPANGAISWEKPSIWHDVDNIFWKNSNWPRAKSSWLYSIPEGLYRTLTWIRDHYQNVETIITENGWSDDGEINDVARIKYLELHFEEMIKAIKDGCNVKGHTSNSLLDSFQWEQGYTEKFGIFRVNIEDSELQRVEKDSADWLRNVIKNREFTIVEDEE